MALKKAQREALEKYKVRVEINFGRKWNFLRRRVANDPSSFNRALMATAQTVKISVPAAIVIFLCVKFEVLDKNSQFNWESLTSLVLSLAATWSTCFWNIDSTYGRQWTYCQDQFNTMNQAKTVSGRKFRAGCLASDLLDTKLWAHKTFAKTFYDVLKDAAESTSAGQWEKELDSGKFEMADVEYLLSVYIDVYRQVSRDTDDVLNRPGRRA